MRVFGNFCWMLYANVEPFEGDYPFDFTDPSLLTRSRLRLGLANYAQSFNDPRHVDMGRRSGLRFTAAGADLQGRLFCSCIARKLFETVRKHFQSLSVV